jgi:hypothetical protein
MIVGSNGTARPSILHPYQRRGTSSELMFDNRTGLAVQICGERSPQASR